MLNRCLDDAIAGAVTMYQRESQQSRLDRRGAAWQRADRFPRPRIAEPRQHRDRRVRGAQDGKRRRRGKHRGGARSKPHRDCDDLIAGSIDEVRLTKCREEQETDPRCPRSSRRSGLPLHWRPHARGIKLIVPPVQEGLAIEADQAILAAVIGNLLQNAFKFTRPCSTVTLRVVGAQRRPRAHRGPGRMRGPSGRGRREGPVSARSSSEAPTEPAWASASRFCRWGRRSQRRPALHPQSTLARDVSLPWTCRGARCQRSRSRTDETITRLILLVMAVMVVVTVVRILLGGSRKP